MTNSGWLLAMVLALVALPGCVATGDAAAVPSTPAAKAVHPPVAMLLAEAQLASRAGDHARAGALVERAIRLDTRNPDLYLALARVRINQGQPAQADGLARRALALAPGDRRIDQNAREVVAAARELGGDAAGAAAVRAGEELTP